VSLFLLADLKLWRIQTMPGWFWISLLLVLPGLIWLAVRYEPDRDGPAPEPDDPLSADAAAWRQLVLTHNRYCTSNCDHRVAHGHCAAYVGRGRRCTDCPKDYLIEIPEELADAETVGRG
jgi:hypothetical protein